MKNASSISFRGWRHNLAIFAAVLLVVMVVLFGLALPCDGNPLAPWLALLQGFQSTLAEVNLKAQPSGYLVVQSSKQVVDTSGHLWQITIYKYPQSIDPQPLMLGLKGIQTSPVIRSETPLHIRLQNGQTISAPAYPLRPSLDWGADVFDARYDLSTLWPTVDQSEAITLVLPFEATQPVEIPIPPQMLQEWHTVASCRALLCTSL